jgi:hypothetical protein
METHSIYDVFLSHISRDQDAVERIAQRLHAESQREPFLDKRHLIAALEADWTVVIRDRYYADPHLEGADLWIITLIESSVGEGIQEGEDVQMQARIGNANGMWRRPLASAPRAACIPRAILYPCRARAMRSNMSGYLQCPFSPRSWP